jgi:hypothetical protein
MRALTLLCILWLLACVPEIHAQWYESELPPNVYVDLAGEFTLSAAGELSLTLAEPCTVRIRLDSHQTNVRPDSPETKPLRCHRVVLDMVHVFARTPWGSQVPGVWLNEDHLVFRVDWNSANLDLPDADLAALIARPWKISGTTWTPSVREVRQILKLLDAADMEPDRDSRGPPPNLAITRFEFEGGTLRAGGTSTLTLQIANRGPGTAYRVVAIVRSGIMSLHGRRARFGTIPPGADKLRRLQLTLPPSEAAPDTMLVVRFDEGNGFSPSSISRRVAIAPPVLAPVIAVHCWIPGRSPDRPDFDAGEDIMMQCLVDNSGTGAANVTLESSLARSAPAAQRVAPGGNVLFDVPITIPRTLAIDSPVEITVVARDRRFARAMSTQIVGVIHKPRLCHTGELTHTQYRVKLAALRAARAAGNLTPDQFDQYDAELVSCLNDAP